MAQLSPLSSKNEDRQRGYMLPLAIFVFLIAFGMAVEFSSTIKTEVAISSGQGFSVQCFEAANSGLEWACWSFYVDDPTDTTINMNRAWTPAAGTFTGGSYSLSVNMSEDETPASATFGDVTTISAIQMPGFGRFQTTQYRKTLRTTIPNLANDEDGNPLTTPTLTASSEVIGEEAWRSGDGRITTGWLASSNSSEWLAVDLASQSLVRKVLLIFPDARVQSYTLQVRSGGSWSNVSGAVSTVDNSPPAHQYLSVTFDTVMATAVRIIFDVALAPPAVEELKVYPPARGALFAEVGL